MVIGAEGVAPCGSGNVVAGASCAGECDAGRGFAGLSPEGAWAGVDPPDGCAGVALEAAAAAEEWDASDFFLEEPGCFFDEPDADEEDLLDELLEEFFAELLEDPFFLEEEEWDDLDDEDLPDEEPELP